MHGTYQVNSAVVDSHRRTHLEFPVFFDGRESGRIIQMVRKLLPCPVCGAESFIESVTQGGLICSDCGAVSNQVEVADDEDDITSRPAFVRPQTYTHVTEEESQAKRDRRVLLKVRDKRSTMDILECLQRMLDHMMSSLVNKGLCSRLALATTRDAWFTFLTRMSLLHPAPSLLESRWGKNKLVGILERWGIPTRLGQIEIVMSGLPPERRRQWSALLLMMEERNISVEGMVVVEEAPELIYAHDWLCMFFGINTFPFPDYIFLRLLPTDKESPVHSTTLSGLLEMVKDPPLLAASMSANERRFGIRLLMHKILSNEVIREDFFHEKNLPFATPIPVNKPLPRIDMTTLLAIIIIGIRNANGGVQPVNILNWIARGDLPFFSAHKCLPAPLERIEYYWFGMGQNSYMQSSFCPISAPGIEDLEILLDNVINTVGVSCKLNDPINLMKTGMDMLGLSSASVVAEQLISAVWFGSIVGGSILFVPQNVGDRRGYEMKSRGGKRGHRIGDPFGESRINEIVMSDIRIDEFAVIIILFVMKLIFPGLHASSAEPATQDDKPMYIQTLINSLPVGGIEYHVMSNRCHQFDDPAVKFGTSEYWDSLTEIEKISLLSFVDSERFNEIRECLVDKEVREFIRDQHPGEGVSSQTRSVPLELILRSGPLVSSYSLTSEVLDLYCPLSYVIRDVMRACSRSRTDATDLARIGKLLREFELKIFSPRFSFTK